MVLLPVNSWNMGFWTWHFWLQGVGAAGAAYGERGAEYVELHAASEKSPCAHRDAANDRTARCRVVEQTEDEKHEQVGCDVPRCAVVSMKHQEVLALIQIWCWLCVKLPYWEVESSMCLRVLTSRKLWQGTRRKHFQCHLYWRPASQVLAEGPGESSPTAVPYLWRVENPGAEV